MLKNPDADCLVDSDGCLFHRMVLVSISKHITKSFVFTLLQRDLYTYIFPENVTRELVMRVIGLDKTLPVKGALGFQKCGQHGVGGIPTK